MLVSDGHSNFNLKPVQVITETVETLREAGVAMKAVFEIDYSS